MFEGLMANLVMPETTFGPRSFGLNDLRWAQVQVSTQPKPCTTRVGHVSFEHGGRHGAYGGFGVEGLPLSLLRVWSKFNQPEPGIVAMLGLCDRKYRSPHASVIALSVLPQEPIRNIVNLRTIFPEVYASDGGFMMPSIHHWLDRSSTVGARPIHDHGRARQRYQSRGHAAPFL